MELKSIECEIWHKIDLEKQPVETKPLENSLEQKLMAMKIAMIG